MKMLVWAGVVLSAIAACFVPAPVAAQPVTSSVMLPGCKNAVSYMPCQGVVLINPDGTAAGNGSAATSTPLVGTASTSGWYGPFTPQLGRLNWLTVSGTWTGSVFVYVTIDGVCSDGAYLNYPGYGNGYAGLGAFQNGTAPEGIETRGNAQWCLNFAVNSGVASYRLAQ